MWQQTYQPLMDSLGWSTLAAALPIFVPLLLIGVLRKPAWVAGLAGLATALVIAIGVYRMPAPLAVRSATMGAAFGLLPIGWIVYWAVVLYRLTDETGNFRIIKDSIGGLTTDRRLQAMLIAFAFGAFVEGAAGFGTPVAVAAAMLTGLGFSPFFAAGICLLANTAPVAFGSIGVPVVTLAGTTGLPEHELSAWVGRLCAPISLLIPAYLVLVMGGWRGLKGVLPAALVCGICFAGVQFLVSNFVGPQLVDILAALTAMVGLIVLFRFWQPSDGFVLAGEHPAAIAPAAHGFASTLRAWSPYLFLVLFVLIWGYPKTKAILETTNLTFDWPGLHNQIQRSAPIVANPSPYAARFNFNWLASAGSACALATMVTAIVLRVSFTSYVRLLGRVARQLAFSLLTMTCVLALAYVMNYSGATVTLGEAFAMTGSLFPFFSALLGWLGVFLTGSDTSANALFGNLQVVTAHSLGLSPAMMAASNSAGGVMGKMISLTSIAVAVAATGMARSEEAKLFRFTVKHSVLLASLLGVLATIYAYAELNPALRLSDCHNFQDFRRLAQRRLPGPIFNYIDGAADDEVTYRRNTAAFERCDLVPNVLRGVQDIDLSVTVMGQKLALPVYCSPTALQRLFHHSGERAVAAAASRFGTLFGVSSLGTVSLTELRKAHATPQCYQFYVHKDHGLNRAMLQSARQAGVNVMMLTVDTITGGNRERDLRTGFSIPLRLSLAGMLQFALKPMWGFNYLRHERFRMPQLEEHIDMRDGSISIGRYFSEMLDPSMDWNYVAGMVKEWNGQFCLKGVMSVEDARRAVDIGCTGIVLSNHGGRQLDGSRSGFDQLAEIVDAVGDRIDVMMDGGVQRGTHVLKALSLGARAVGLGRYYLFPLAAAGQAGVERALTLMRAELERGMKLMGCNAIDQLTRANLRFRSP